MNEALYRRCCLVLVACRFTYYVKGDTLLDDADYDRFEDKLKAFEARHPKLAHPKSPTVAPGSDLETSYPASIRSFFGQDPTPPIDRDAWAKVFAELEAA